MAGEKSEQDQVREEKVQKLDPDQQRNLSQGTVPRGGETRQGGPNLAEAGLEEGEDKPYTTVNPMQMDREPSFRLDEHRAGVQRQPQPYGQPSVQEELPPTAEQQKELKRLKK